MGGKNRGSAAVAEPDAPAGDAPAASGAKRRLFGAKKVGNELSGRVEQVTDRVQEAAADTVQDVSKRARKAQKQAKKTARKAQKKAKKEPAFQVGLAAIGLIFVGGIAAGIALGRKKS